jgi:hypothetical protein
VRVLVLGCLSVGLAVGGTGCRTTAEQKYYAPVPDSPGIPDTPGAPDFPGVPVDPHRS